MEIQNTSILITGGSAGLGLALATRLGRDAGRVVLVGRNPTALNRAVEAVRALGGEAYGIQADIGNKDDIYKITGQATALAGAIDILIQNASTLGPVPLRLLLDTDCEDLEHTLAVNLVGPFRLAKALIGPMALRGRGLVVSISSDAAVEAYSGWGVYGISKAALDHMTRIFAAELHDTGVRFLSIDPGEMDTGMHAAAMPDADRSTLVHPEDIADRIARIIRTAEQIPNGTRLTSSAAGV